MAKAPTGRAGELSMGLAMNKQTLIWTLIIAVPVGLAALVTGYVYRDTGEAPVQTASETAAPQTSSEKGDALKSAKAPEKEEAPASEAAAAETAAAEPATTDETPAETTVSSAIPSFDVVGIEPTGETVVAGRSDAGAIVAMLANGQVVGKTIANEAGEWTIILDEPLKPGDYDVALEVHDQNGEKVRGSEQRVAVSIAEGGQEQPLVVLNTPDGPSNVLQKPEEPKAVAEAPASSQPEAPKAEETKVAAAPSSEDTEKQSASGTTSPTTEAKPDAAPVSNEVKQTAQAPIESTEEPVSEPAPVAETTEVAAAAPKAETADVDSTKTEVGSVTPEQAPSAPVKAPETETASAETTQEPAKVEGKPSVTVEAVETEKGKVYVAGTAEPGSSVRVYVGEDYQGEAKANTDGKWLLEGNKNVAEGNVEVRADKIGEDGSSVDARAAVVFEKEKEQQIVLTKVVASGSGSSTDAQGAEVKKALPVVIIRKGDNLWRISRRLYGDGIRYTTIYQANKGQIRDPDLIYPGQIFLTPEGDLNWPEQDGENG